MGKYDKIKNTPYPFEEVDRKHPPMTRENRAKIFMPFAALKGYEKALESKRRITVPKADLSEESKENLDFAIWDIMALLKEKKFPVVEVIFFEKEKDLDEGIYRKLTGVAVKVDENSKYIQIVEKKIPVGDIYALVILRENR